MKSRRLYAVVVQKGMKPAGMRPLKLQGRAPRKAGLRRMGALIKRSESVSLSVWASG